MEHHWHLAFHFWEPGLCLLDSSLSKDSQGQQLGSLSSPLQRQFSHRNPSHCSPSKQCILISVCLLFCRTRRRDFRKNPWMQTAQYKFTPMKSGMTQNFGCVVEKEFWILIANFQGNCCNESWTLVLTLAISGRDVVLYRTACMISKQDKNLETMKEFGTY